MDSANQDETQSIPSQPDADSQDDETTRIPVDSTPEDSRTDEVESPGPDGGETVAIEVPADAGGPEEPPDQPVLSKGPWRWILIVGLAALLLIAAASAFGGYLSGIDQRTQFESTQVAGKVAEQFQLGVQDIEAGRFELARQRFEYVINLAPDFPGVTENLARVLLELNTTATPTFVPTPTLTPTPDLRGAEELFSQAQVMLADERWSEAIDTLLKLRKDEPEYNTVDVDSMFYVALRNRGVQRILSEGDLEGGTYDLALAERFGPLDFEASNNRDWADLYVTGASFWGLDWGQAAFYFGQIINVAPNLRDNTNLTATERFIEASIKYGDVLAENKEWCDARDAYQAAYDVSLDSALNESIDFAADKCREGEKPDEDEGEPPPEEEETPQPPGTTEPPPEGEPTATEPPPEGEPTATEQPPEGEPTTTEPNPSPTP